MTTLIKNGIIVDGSLRAPFKGDIYIRNGVISAIGNLGRQSAETQINAAGSYVSPGFIDVNSSSDHYLTLITNSKQQDFLFQGVTTTFGGLCGSSLAPLLYCELLSIRKWANDLSKINVDWKTVDDFLRTLKKRGLGVNFGTLLGHSTVRRALVGESLRELTNNELAVFEKILLKSLDECAFGFSTGLSYVHAHNTSHHELVRLISIVARKGGLYATHLRSETTGLISSIQETVEIGKETKVKTLINHLRPIKGFEAEYSKALLMLSQSAADLQIYFDLYPFEMSHVPIYSLLPKWVQNGGIEIMLKNIKEKSKRLKILKDFHLEGDGDDIIIASAPRLEYLVGKTLKEFSKKRNIDIKEGLLQLMDITQLQCTVFCRNVDIELTKKSLAHERALISSNAESSEPGSFKNDRSTSTFTKFLDIVLRENLLSIEAAVQKISATPAILFGLKNRGLLKEGMKADITIFNHDMSNGTKIDYVLMNGEVVVENNILKKERSGEILKRTNY